MMNRISLSLLFSLILNIAFCLENSLLEITLFDGKKMNLSGNSLEEINQIQAIPIEKYQIYEVPTLGSFYIDIPYDTIKSTLIRGDVWEPHIVTLIKKYTQKGTIAIDIGSHIGTHLISMSQAVGEKGHVIGFEPQMKIFSELVMNMILNQCHNVRAYRCAVGREFSQVQMNFAFSSNEGGTAIGKEGDKAPLIPLDALLLDSVSLIKIDVEGYEDEVLAGAEETIHRNHPYIIIELMDQTTYHVQKREATIRSLEKMGYTVIKLWGWDWFAIPKN